MGKPPYEEQEVVPEFMISRCTTHTRARIESIDERAQKNDWIIAGQDEMWKRRVRPEGPYQENRYAKDDAP
ncbi:hypothetical protein PDE_00188 [Penicillium oxalicum 114-2]|uniref:Uncharacterized protein n=1 Tax=Penicillium oxalicum (strain 114-2 / CGMCC 5302) TaxID=933388 RepID=S7Z402_PENO1|nr:hypothetical protein PDE_00188 [Penicillium oxalicum 114-2]